MDWYFIAFLFLYLHVYSFHLGYLHPEIVFHSLTGY